MLLAPPPWANALGAAVVAKATAKELRAYQAVMALQARFDVIHKAWTGSYMTPARVRVVGEVSNAKGQFSWQAMDMGKEFFYWDEPALVGNPRLNGQMLSRTGRPAPVSTSLLLIAAEPEDAGYRLATFDDLRQRARMEWDTRAAASRAHGRAQRFGVGSF